MLVCGRYYTLQNVQFVSFISFFQRYIFMFRTMYNRSVWCVHVFCVLFWCSWCWCCCYCCWNYYHHSQHKQFSDLWSVFMPLFSPCTHTHERTVSNVILFGINNSHSNIVWVFVHFMVDLHHVDKFTSESLNTQTHNNSRNNNNNNYSEKTREQLNCKQFIKHSHTQANGRTCDTHFPHKMFTLCKFLWMSRRKTKKRPRQK